MDSISTIKKNLASWYITEPILFAVYTMHALVVNNNIKTIRVGRKRIEFNERYISSLSKRELHEVLLFELVRILLKHPYSRQQPQRAISYIASSITIQELLNSSLDYPLAKDIILNDTGVDDISKRHLEWYYARLIEMSLNGWFSNTDESANNLSFNIDQASMNSELWCEDELQIFEIDNLIKENQFRDGWGTISNSIKELVIASTIPQINYQSILKQFRTTVLSSDIQSNRMRPSRRLGFGFPGIKRLFTTKLAIFVDTSGSMSNETISKGLGLISGFFRYGIMSIDYFEFDAQIQKSTAKKLSKSQKAFTVSGRGGTNFQIIFDFLEKEQSYDGVIIYTDGFAPTPLLPKAINRKHVVWVLPNKHCYDNAVFQLVDLGRLCCLDLIK